MKKIMLIGLVLLVAVLAGGCASYTAKEIVPTNIDEDKVIRSDKDDISVIAFPLVSEKDCKEYFDEDLLDKNILAVYLTVVNNNQENIKFISSNLEGKKSDFAANPLPEGDVYKSIRRGYTGKSLLWMFTTWYVGGAISTMHTKSINNKIEADLRDKILKFGDLKPKESIHGFLWFKLPDTAMSTKATARNLVLKLLFEKDGKTVNHKLAFPSPKKSEFE